MQKALKYYMLLLFAWSSLLSAESSVMVEEMPWKEGEIVAHGKHWGDKTYRKFIKKTPEGYIVQEFFVDNQRQATNPFLLVNKEDVTRLPWHYHDFEEGENKLFIQGSYKRWYANGKPERVGRYNLRSKRVGFWTLWQPNGYKRVEGYYLDGELDGLWKHWLESGKPSTSFYYNNGQSEASLTAEFKDDDFTTEPEVHLWVERHKNGSVMSVGKINRGKRDGVWFFLDDKGKRESRGTYKEGKKDGLWTTYWIHEDKKLQKKTEGEYREGKKVGRWLRWSQEGHETEEFFDSAAK